VAYAEKQAALLDHLAHSSAECWLPVLKAHGITPSWGVDYVVVIEDDQIPVPAADEDEWEDEDEGDVDDHEVDDVEDPIDDFEDDY